ncbi:unnamed protein product [Coffea canephora]|uniref:Uncharacterized protein n=1 Tax=Coffea canephora TaxID=49390 RepID=A0A068UJB4_COFCA|nr:unnamed protein product [Coffea canephora]
MWTANNVRKSHNSFILFIFPYLIIHWLAPLFDWTGMKTPSHRASSSPPLVLFCPTRMGITTPKRQL